MAESNRVKMLSSPETSQGVLPATPVFTEIRISSEDLKPNQPTTTSPELRSDRKTTDLIRTNRTASGSINFPFVMGSHDDFLRSVLQAAAWAAAVVVTGTTISAAAADNSFNDSANGFGALQPNQWVRVTGFATAGNNGWCKILTRTAAKITVGQLTLVNEAAGPSVSVDMGQQIVEGVTPSWYTLEKQFLDNTNDYAVYPGSMFSRWNLNVQTSGVITGSLSVMALDELSYTVTRASALGGSEVPASTADQVLNAVDDVVAVYENGTKLRTVGFNWQYDNNLRERQEVARLGTESVGSGSIGITGSFNYLYRDPTVYNRFNAFTNSSLAAVFRKGTKSMVVDFPRIKLSQGQRTAGGLNTDVVVPMNWTAFMHETEGVMCRIQRWTS